MMKTLRIIIQVKIGKINPIEEKKSKKDKMDCLTGVEAINRFVN